MTTMRKVVLATDFSPPSQAALERTRLLAATLGAEVILVHAFDAGRPGASIHDDDGAEQVAADRNAIGLLLETARLELASAGIRVTALRVDGFPAEVIAHTARAEAADLVVVAAHGRSGARRFLGTVAEKVLRATPIPVLVARGAADSPFRKVLAATDFGEPAERSLEAALVIAGPDVRVEIVHVAPVMPLLTSMGHDLLPVDMRALGTEAQPAGAALVARHARPGLDMTFAIADGEPSVVLLRKLRSDDHDLLVVGSHARHGLDKLRMGSVSAKLTRRAPCSVLVAR